MKIDKNLKSFLWELVREVSFFIWKITQDKRRKEKKEQRRKGERR